MKKYLLSVFFVTISVILPFTFVSCNGDDDAFDASVVGTWEVTYIDVDSAFGDDSIEDGFSVGDRFTLNADGTYEDAIDTGRWKQEGSSLTITIDAEYSIPAEMKIEKLTDSAMELTQDYQILQCTLKCKRVE